ncbi:MAG: 4Fe-4S dicluster domain-containing protein [Sulfuritalea sp.]|nr:4Fe-4S dicluster domain-containing protein [Sulfuritalea sp.]MBK8119411.1 4Fe-4S dicluster domain-containing protein [Sulfuritalea sp.]
MALEIIESCVNCWACLPLCPSRAIHEARPPQFPHFLIDADKCTECVGDFADPQCVAICPIEGAIVDELGVAMNPPGSLTGIPPERWAAAQAEIAAR